MEMPDEQQRLDLSVGIMAVLLIVLAIDSLRLECDDALHSRERLPTGELLFILHASLLLSSLCHRPCE